MQWGFLIVQSSFSISSSADFPFLNLNNFCQYVEARLSPIPRHTSHSIRSPRHTAQIILEKVANRHPCNSLNLSRVWFHNAHIDLKWIPWVIPFSVFKRHSWKDLISFGRLLAVETFSPTPWVPGLQGWQSSKERRCSRTDDLELLILDIDIESRSHHEMFKNLDRFGWN